jgi:hypothetical protein
MAKRFDLVGIVRRDIEENTGERTPRFVAEVWVDRMCYSFSEAFAAEPEYAVRQNPDVARHLAYRWRGDEGRKLRAVMREAGLL